MKREAQHDFTYGPWRQRSWFFWQACSCCKQEFRRELGWHFITGPFGGGCGVRRYLCATCAPTEADAIRLYEHRRDYRPPAPPAPPPPPPLPPRARVVQSQ